jgi:hypothetical protein
MTDKMKISDNNFEDLLCLGKRVLNLSWGKSYAFTPCCLLSYLRFDLSMPVVNGCFTHLEPFRYLGVA